MNSKIEFVSIYCKIYTDTFDSKLTNTFATGDEVFEFLMKDCGHCFDKNDNIIPGDSNIWYLGCNEKFGEMRYRYHSIEWGHGESSFDNVKLFIKIMFEDNFITKKQYDILGKKIEEGLLINNMYDIGEYLIKKQNNEKWVTHKDSKTFRENFKKMISNVKNTLERMNYTILR
jgi:hypothetical protein